MKRVSRRASPCRPFLGPKAPLHLQYAEEAGFTTFFQSRDSFCERLIRVEVKNGNPLGGVAGARALPLFDGEITMRHRLRMRRGQKRVNIVGIRKERRICCSPDLGVV